MKKTLKLIALCILAGQMAFAGGIVTNTNQSVKWLRMMSRDASTDIDAVYYNPAGVMALDNGLHFSVSNQSVFQDYTVTNNYLGASYSADVKAPLFPNLYASYKKDKWAVSFGFGPVGGGGSADYGSGIPDVNLYVLSSPSLGVGFGVDQSFKGSSVYYGFQAGFAYEITDWISASVGLRYVYAQNDYSGSLDVSFASVSVLSTEIEATQTGSGICPIVGVNITPIEKLNIGLRWEGNTGIELETKDVKDDLGFMFSEGAKSNKDMPMLITVGAQYQLTDDFRAQCGYELFFDKDADWSGKEDLVDDNLFQLLLGLEYDLNEMFTVSAGIQYCKTGVSDDYQSSMSFSLSSNTVGLGAQINLSEALSVDLGFAKIIYQDMDAVSSAITTNYDKDGYMFGVGLNYSLF